MSRYAIGGAFAAITLAFAPAANATVFPIGSPNFFITSGTPFTPSITAVFFNGYGATTVFDDSYTFTIPQDGLGSGSIATSFSGPGNQLIITDLIINGVSYDIPSTGVGQSRSVGGIPILNGVLNVIQVKGFTIGAGSYAGNMTFTATAVPEPAAWALMIAGFAVLGAAFRRRPIKVAFS